MAKASNLMAVDEIVSLLRQGKNRAEIIATISKKLQRSTRTVDSLIKTATAKFKEDQELAEEVRVRELQASTAEALKEGLKSDLELEVFLCQIAMGDIEIEEIVKGEAVLRNVSPFERIQAINTIYKKRGSFAPEKRDVNLKFGKEAEEYVD